MKKLIKKVVGMIILAAFAVCLTSCGTILYPDRRGQKAGQLDGTVILLDGIGCLFFVLPGVAAFIVDFATGAIYLPPESNRSSKISHDDILIIPMDKNDLNRRGIERVVSSHMGKSVSISDERMMVSHVQTPKDIRAAITCVATFSKTSIKPDSAPDI